MLNKKGLVKSSLLLADSFMVKDYLDNNWKDLIDKVSRSVVKHTFFEEGRMEGEVCRSLNKHAGYSGEKVIKVNPYSLSMVETAYKFGELSETFKRIQRIILSSGSVYSYIEPIHRKDICDATLEFCKLTCGEYTAKSAAKDVVSSILTPELWDIEPLSEEKLCELFSNFHEVELDIFISKTCAGIRTKDIASKYGISSSRVGQIYNKFNSNLYRKIAELRDKDDSWKEYILTCI